MIILVMVMVTSHRPRGRDAEGVISHSSEREVALA